MLDRHQLVLAYRRAQMRDQRLLHLSDAENGLRPASVLVPVVERDRQLHVLFIERAAHLRHHAGQIGFPGGALEKNDASPLSCALREAEEEIGLRPNKVEILGPLLPRITRVSGFFIQPFLAFLHDFEATRLDTNEVSGVFEAPLNHFLNVDHYLWETVLWQGQKRGFYQIDFEQKRIWGATAGMLVEMANLLLPDQFSLKAPVE